MSSLGTRSDGARRGLVAVFVGGALVLGSIAGGDQAQAAAVGGATAVDAVHAADDAALAAAPRRNNNKTNAVYFVHGFTRSGHHDCEQVWGVAKAAFRASHWRGRLVTWGYYRRNTHCTRNYAGTTDSRLREVGRQLAWDIYNNYTRHGKKVDIVAHSMGGLVARAALRGTQTRTAGFPRALYVEDVITLSTPHTGTNWANGCALTHYQCRDMKPRSAFLRWLGPDAPVSTISTDWTLIGAGDDDTVTSGSATGLRNSVGHRIVYCGGQGLEHNVIIKKSTGNTWCQSVWHHNHRQWVRTRGPSPVRRAVLGAYYWSAQ
jgi:hypothetical protein